MSNFFEFNCPSCGRTHLVDADEIAEPGIWRTCPSCGQQVFVTQEGVSAGLTLNAAAGAPAPEPAPEVVAAGPPAVSAPVEEQGLGVHLRMPGGGIGRVSTEAIEHGVQSGRIRPWDLVSEDGQHFEPISGHPELGNLFLESDFAVPIQRRCANHPDAAPAGTCRQCGRSYCEECVGKLMPGQPRQCPACAGAVREPDPRLTERPLWERWREIAVFPIDEDAWKLTLGLGVVLWAASFSLWTMPLYLLALGLLVHVVSRSAEGDKKLKATGDIDYRALFGRTWPAAVLTMVVVIPFPLALMLLGPNLGVLFHFPLTLLVALYYPMALGLVVLMDGRSEALQPRRVLRSIAAIREDYLLCVLFLFVAAVAVLGLQTIAGYVPGLRNVLMHVAVAYGLLIQAHLVGFLLYMNRERILAAA